MSKRLEYFLMKSEALRRYFALDAANWPPPWDYRHRLAVRGSQTDEERRRHDLAEARWTLERQSGDLRAHAREMMLRHKAVIWAQRGEVRQAARESWKAQRQNVDYYLEAWKAQREVVCRLEAKP